MRMRQRGTVCIAIAACALVALTGPATAAGSPARVLSNRLGLAGYHFSVSGISRIHVRGTFTVPNSTCGNAARYYQLQIGAGFKNGSTPGDAIVVIELKCKSGTQDAGYAQLVAGYNVIDPAASITAGETVTIAVTAESSRSAARIALPGGKSYYISGNGGSPRGGDYALTISSPRPPHFSTVTFSNCTVNGTDLSSFQPKAWESVTSSGKVDGSVSSLHDGTSFTISS